MLETWAKIKIWTEYIIPAGVIGSIFLITIIVTVKKSIQWDRKIKLLENNGFERYLWDVASVGDKAWYAWKRDDVRLKETEIENMSYRELKQRIKR